MRLQSVLFSLIAVSACDENSAAPAVVTAEALCEHLRNEGCPQGDDPSCEQNNDLGADEFPECEEERNELRRCYFIDLPAEAEQALSVDPATCVLSSACEGEADRLCRCERGPGCDIET